MTNESKANVSNLLLILAVIVSVLIFLFIHDEAGNTIFISQVENWSNAVWTQNIIELVVVWIVVLAVRFTVLKQSPPPK